MTRQSARMISYTCNDLPRATLTLPLGCSAKYVGEGSANVVFEIQVPPNLKDDKNLMFLRGRLLRVAKTGASVLDHVESQAYREKSISPLFKPHELVEQSLVGLGGSGIVKELNRVLENSADMRRESFRSSKVADLPVGMLVEDMRARQDHPGEIALELKPKWLAQCANAPADSTRCRTCANEASKERKGDTPVLFCPLDLIECATDELALDRVAEYILGMCFGATPQQREHLKAWLRSASVDLFTRLRRLQTDGDPRGPLAADEEPDHNLCLAMTLRDCACFVRIPSGDEGPVEAKLADLDKKDWKAKLEKWKATEMKLIQKRFYYDSGRRTNCRIGRMS